MRMILHVAVQFPVIITDPLTNGWVKGRGEIEGICYAIIILLSTLWDEL